jgi:hypothetical protein
MSTLLEHLESLAEQTSTLRHDILFGDDEGNDPLEGVDDFPETTQHVMLGLNALESAERHFKLASITLNREQNSDG